MQFLSPDFCPCLIFWHILKGFCGFFFCGSFTISTLQGLTQKAFQQSWSNFFTALRKFSNVYTTIQIQELYREIRASVSSTCNFSRNLLSFLLSYKNLESFSKWMFYCFESLVSHSKNNNISFVPWAANFAEHMPTLSMKFSILD